MKMLRYIAEQPLTVRVSLARLKDNVYALVDEMTPFSFLKAGARIWVGLGNCYCVYELTVAWDRDETSLVEFLEEMCEEIDNERM